MQNVWNVEAVLLPRSDNLFLKQERTRDSPSTHPLREIL